MPTNNPEDWLGMPSLPGNRLLEQQRRCR